jgi:hypothetical protein
MSVLASAEVTQLVTRHMLLVTDEGAGGLPAVDSAELILFGPGSLALVCAGSEMGGTVTIERHDAAPTGPQGPEWQLASEGSFDLPTGNLALSDLEGPLEWFPDLGLYADRWQIRVHVTGRAAAALLEDQILAEAEASYDSTELDLSPAEIGPEKWLIQLWR